jgi:UDP-N-acetylglucosamine--N-acetylmuramyl-(pentapeptide) pyrophosphoryl-undecaprenol N-acetylglucosamine transferase
LINQDTRTRVAVEANTLARLPVVIVMAGGTGGHVFPALEVARRVAEAGFRIVWIGAKKGMEAALVPRHGFEMAWLRFSGVRGKGMLSQLLLPLRLLVAFAQALVILARHRKATVIGFGGYITFPGGLMAVLLGRGLLLHEQNAIAGLSNRVLARVADRVMTAFPETLPNGQWVGNPVRESIVALPPPAARYAGRRGPLRVLVLGGSLGAQALNRLLPRACALLGPLARPVVRHQAGAAHRDELAALYAACGVEAETEAFIDDMAAAYAEADLVVCRAGAMTVAEIACAGVAALFVPYPHAVDDHQAANAGFLARHGAALLVRQAELDEKRLATIFAKTTRADCLGMAEKARAYAKPDAAADVARATIALAGRA